MSKRTGLGRGLGAFFGDEYEAPVKKAKSSEAEQDNEGKKKPSNQDMENGSNLETGVKITGDSEETVSSGKAAEKLVQEKIKIVEVEKEKYLDISLVEPNREQPRKMFDEEQLAELSDSIKEFGVLQPLLVQKQGEYYEIIAGERRWRAAKLAGLKEVPVVIREYSRQQSMEIALVENVQREDLNPIEEAKAYQMLVQEFGLKQEEVAARVSKNRATVTNSMRLLKLDERVQNMLIRGQISGGHARTLLSLEDHEQQYQIAEKIEKSQLSVRETERLVKLLMKPAAKKKEPKEEERDVSIFYQELEEKLKTVMGTKVTINKKDKNKGRIEIEYYSSAELERIAELLESIQN